VYGDFYQVSNQANSNRIILAINQNSSDHQTDIIKLTQANENLLSEQFQRFGVDVKQLSKSMRSTKTFQDWQEGSQLLTDQFAPANLLNLEAN
jgi:spermidine synthase